MLSIVENIIYGNKLQTVLRIGPYRFHFYSNEYNEPPHIHVECDDTEVKFWLEPILLARNDGMKAHLVREIEKLIFKNHKYLLEKYNEYHNS